MNNEQTPALRQAVESMATMREAYDNLSQAAEAYNVGKTQLAQAITSKGVETSPAESYPEMAEKVAQIPLETTIYEGADSYGKQIGAGGSLWDLYQVLADMKTRFMGTGDYAALIVCEYYKGHDSLVLQGADGYYTCDGDYYDYASPNHVWHDADNGKMNRWVAFLYRNEGARLDITNTAISPRSIYIGGHIGTIEYLVNGRLTDLVCGVEDSDVLDNFNTAGYTQLFSKRLYMKAGRIASVLNIGDVDFCILKMTNNIGGTISQGQLRGTFKILDIEVANPVYISQIASCFVLYPQKDASQILGIRIKGKVIPNGYNTSIILIYGIGYTINLSGLQFIEVEDMDSMNAGGGVIVGTLNNLELLKVGAMTTNLNVQNWTASLVLADNGRRARLIDNIKNYILARVSDRTGLSQLTFTIATSLYDNIASEQIEWQGETMSLADAFLTKNWLLAGA